MKASDGNVVYLVPLAIGYVADLHRERDAAIARISTLGARIAKDEAAADERHARLVEVADKLRAARAERDEARFERDSYISAHNELEEVAKVIRAERDEAVGLLREWRMLAASKSFGEYERHQIQDVRSRRDAYLARLAAAPEAK